MISQNTRLHSEVLAQAPRDTIANEIPWLASLTCFDSLRLSEHIRLFRKPAMSQLSRYLSGRRTFMHAEAMSTKTSWLAAIV